MKIQKFISLVSIIFFVIHSAPMLVNCNPIVYQNASDIKHVYIVHVQKPQGTKFLRFTDRVSWYKSYLPNSTLDSGEPRLVYAYRYVVSGFAARLTSEEVKTMEKLEGFVSAYPELEEKAFTTYSPQFLGLNKWSGLWPDSIMGQGQVIGVIDSGIKPTHPSFHDNAGLPPPPSQWAGQCYWGRPICNNKLIGAVGYIYGFYVNPIDNIGHGTHCAGTVAGSFVQDASVLGQGKGTASGTAPYAHFAMYKVLDKRGNTNIGMSSDILKGIDEAIRDHVDILSMSLGVPNASIPQGSVSIGSFAAIAKGIVPVAAAGNDGPFPSVITNDAPWVLTVGAANINRRIVVTVKLGNGKEYDGESAYQQGNPVAQQTPLIFPGAKKSLGEMMCGSRDSLNNIDVRGKIVLCVTGNNSNEEKSEIVKAAGGVGLIVVNIPESGNTTGASPNILPAANIGYDDGLELIQQYVYKEKNPTAALIYKGTQTNFRPAPTLASFSSRGPSLHNGNIIKPDIIAPGVNILSAWPVQVGPSTSTKTTKTFNFLSGTSMATPHVAGIVALLKNNHPNWPPAVIKSALMTTAYAVDLDGNPIRDDYKGKASVFGIGAGHVDPVAANDPGLVYDIKLHDYIAYLCGSGFTDYEVTYIVRGQIQCARIKKISADELNYPSISLYLGSNPSRIIKRTVINVGDASSTYRVKFDEPEGVSMDVNPSTLQFNQQGQALSYEVKFSLKSGFFPTAGQYSEGQLAWDSGKYYVRSPIAVTFY